MKLKLTFSILVVLLILLSCTQKSIRKDSSVGLQGPDNVEIKSNDIEYYYIQEDDFKFFRLFGKAQNFSIEFNTQLLIIDTIAKDSIIGQKFYWLKVAGCDKNIPSLYLSKFKFPYVENGKEIKRIDEDGEIRGGNTVENLYTIDAFGCLFEYLRDTLNWGENTSILFHSEGDEESLWRQKACRFSSDSLSFFGSIQLLVYISNLTDNTLKIKQNYLYNNDVKIWYAVYKLFKNKDILVFCRVIEKDGYIQLAVDYDYSHDYNYITKELGLLLRNKDYDGDLWKSQISLDEQFTEMEKTLNGYPENK